MIEQKIIARVFPRKTNATPDDKLAFFKTPPLVKFLPKIDEVHVSVAFTYDIDKAEYLARQWGKIGIPVKIGGPAFGEPSGEFVPGLYLKMGNVITSRGCPNHCWFCSVHKREGTIRELAIHDGWNVRDDNLLACSEGHIREVFAMLKKQPKRPIFSGGLEAKLLKDWHCELLAEVKTQRAYFAYDTANDREPLFDAGKMLKRVNISVENRIAECYVLIGYRGDTFEKAETRLLDTIKAGFMPYAMLFKDDVGNTDKDWQKFQREWCRPTIVAAKIRDLK